MKIMDPNTTSYERKDVEESLKDEDSLRWRNNSSSTTCCHEGASDDDESLEYDEMETLVGKDGDNVDRRIRKNDLSKSILVKNWLPDGPWRICGAQILEVEAVKLVKFFFVTVLTILAVHYYAIVVNAKRDEEYSLREMVLYDGNHVVLDIFVFFFVGRLHQQPSVDSLAWTLPAFGSAIVLSFFASIPAFQHSITPYEINCSWSWQMWAAIILGVLPLFGGLIAVHFIYAFRHDIGARKLVELFLSILIFLVPYASSHFLHLHHWYYAWILGMHANLNVWWSRLTMAFFWGIYINGIAIFGRDPIMTCAITLYQSQNQLCPYTPSSEEYTLETLFGAIASDPQDCGTALEDAS